MSTIHSFSLAPGSTIGILGGGQLGRMMAIAAAELGYRTHIFTPEKDAPACEVATHCTIAAYDDAEALRAFAQSVQVVTYEFENIPAAPVAQLANLVPVRPEPAILAVSQHRVEEKTALHKLGIATAPFAAVTNAQEYEAGIAQLGLPAVLKTCRMGYDGKGQWMLRTQNDAQNAASTLGTAPDFILEGFVDFRMEISVIVARAADGHISSYDAVQNIHKNHILSETIVPAPISPELAQRAANIAQTIAEGLNLIGLIAVEMFITGADDILVNELAPRPHNSGHWTIDACVTSQFEQVIRAICGLPLGSTKRLCNARMLNLIGPDVHDWKRYIGEPNAKLHLYGKHEIRAGRKMGHVTFLDLK